MSAYRIEKPCTIVDDGKAVRHNKPGVVIELDDALAASLGSKVSRHGVAPEPESAPEPEPQTPEPEAEAPPRPRRPRPGGDDG